eukprot:CAMPEP_0116904334 /NCGR_PEP_ID=MMETSP0467-20121206/11355_1 /TAXON_ID=283647 /ORGANISM="Mesodinium pulex, Strain SPMC105" /LENGTH=77 /DNA_ID=CAMNT_0004578955 /DNA_START=621 /DNA_END=854 /DNA_ORIENTATION=-
MHGNRNPDNSGFGGQIPFGGEVPMGVHPKLRVPGSKYDPINPLDAEANYLGQLGGGGGMGNMGFGINDFNNNDIGGL